MNRQQRRRAEKLRARQQHVRRSRAGGVSEELRMRIVKDARDLLFEKSPMMYDEMGSCVYQTAALVMAGMYNGLTEASGNVIVPQAGTCYWKRVDDEDDDGKVATHFGYEYNPKGLPKMNGLPEEIHVWAAIPALGEIIDLNSRNFPTACERMTGMDWPGVKPPDYLWVKADVPMDRGIYIPDEEATLRATQAVIEIWKAWKQGLQYVPEGYEE